MTHAIAIVAHKDRLGRAHELAEKVGAHQIFEDPGMIGPGRNHLRAWSSLGRHEETEWSVVLEDDAIPVNGFNMQLTAALKVAPEPVVSLYLGTGRPSHWQDSIRDAVPRPECWIVTSALLHHVGVAIRTDMVPQMTDHVLWKLRELPIDEAITLWMRQVAHVRCAYTHPSIVNHDDDLPTTITERSSSHAGETGERNEPRHAWDFGIRETWDSSSYSIRRPNLDYRAVIPS